MGVSAEARFGDCPRVFMRLDAVCEEPSHWETGPNETVSAGIKGGNRRASSVWNTSAFRLPYALLVALNDPSKSPSTPATCAKSPARPCVFVLTKGMSVVGPRPALPNEVATYNDYQRQRLLVKPGMTCYWQTRRNRDSITFDEWVDLDLWRFGSAFRSGDCVLEKSAFLEKGIWHLTDQQHQDFFCAFYG